MEKVKVTLPKGEIEAELNGNCLIVDEKPGGGIFDDLSAVKYGGVEMENCRLVEVGSNDGRYWFAFTEIPESERVRADLDYLLLITE